MTANSTHIPVTHTTAGPCEHCFCTTDTAGNLRCHKCGATIPLASALLENARNLDALQYLGERIKELELQSHMPVICGVSPFAVVAKPTDTGGCGAAIDDVAEIYRCADCRATFHRWCMQKHFSEDHSRTEATHQHLRDRNEKLEAALRDMRAVLSEVYEIAADESEIAEVACARIEELLKEAFRP